MENANIAVIIKALFVLIPKTSLKKIGNQSYQSKNNYSNYLNNILRKSPSLGSVNLMSSFTHRLIMRFKTATVLITTEKPIGIDKITQTGK